MDALWTRVEVVFPADSTFSEISIINATFFHEDFLHSSITFIIEFQLVMGFIPFLFFIIDIFCIFFFFPSEDKNSGDNIEHHHYNTIQWLDEYRTSQQ